MPIGQDFYLFYFSICLILLPFLSFSFASHFGFLFLFLFVFICFGFFPSHLRVFILCFFVNEMIIHI